MLSRNGVWEWNRIWYWSSYMILMRICFSYPNCNYYNKSSKAKGFISKTCFLYSYIQVCHIQVYLSGNYIPVVKTPPKHTSPPSMAVTFLTTYLMAVLQPSGYSIFYGRDTPIQLSLLWWSYFCQCLNTETSTQGNRGITTEIPSISYTYLLYIRLVVIL